MRDPKTPAEWRQAVDLAGAMLLIDSARRYGLIAGGPAIDAGRCRRILDEGRARGIAPIRSEVDRIILAYSGPGKARHNPDDRPGGVPAIE